MSRGQARGGGPAGARFAHRDLLAGCLVNVSTVRDARPDQRNLRRVFMGLYVAYALAFAWAGATSRWPFFVGSVAGVAAAVAEWRTHTPYPPHGAGVHVVPVSWRTRRVPAIFGLPSVLVAFAADYIIAGGRIVDAVGPLAIAVLFVAALVWSSRDVVDRVEIGPDRMILRVLFGFRAVNVGWRDIISVSDREGDGFLRVRNRQGKSYLLSPELSDFAGLRDMLTAAVTS